MRQRAEDVQVRVELLQGQITVLEDRKKCLESKADHLEARAHVRESDQDEYYLEETPEEREYAKSWDDRLAHLDRREKLFVTRFRHVEESEKWLQEAMEENAYIWEQEYAAQREKAMEQEHVVTEKRKATA